MSAERIIKREEREVHRSLRQKQREEIHETEGVRSWRGGRMKATRDNEEGK